MRAFFFLVCTAILICGCTTVSVKKDPGPNDKGFRYYRPKPYLMITPGAAPSKSSDTIMKTTTTVDQLKDIKVKVSGNTKANYQAPELINAAEEKKLECTDANPELARQISISLMYLPDFAEEYSVRLKPGLGIGKLNMTLENGWNLTSVGIETDQQTDEIIKSVADLVGAAGGGGGGEKALDQTRSPQNICTLLATNIPFGMYEAVISRDPCGQKQLYGWRYVGFMPFQSCPVQSGGMQQVCCDDPTAIYGIVMSSNGVMRFEKIAEIPYLDQVTKKTK